MAAAPSSAGGKQRHRGCPGSLKQGAGQHTRASPSEHREGRAQQSSTVASEQYRNREHSNTSSSHDQLASVRLTLLQTELLPFCLLFSY